MNRDELIDQLTGDLAPVSPPAPVWRAAAGWLGLSWGLVAGLTLATGSLRDGWAMQLLASPHFALECALGLAAGASGIALALELAIPGRRPRRRALALAAGTWGLWAGVLLYGLVDPALAPSMLGKRPHCAVEIVLYAVPPLAGALWLLARRAALDRTAATAVAAAAAGSVPALVMQVACMYDPAHAAVFHLGPALLVAALGAAAGRRLLPAV